MRRLLLVLANDVRRHLKAPWAMVIFMVIPLFMTGIIGVIFAPQSDSGQLPPIPVLLVDQDKGLASKLILGSFDVDRMKKMFRVTVTDETDGARRMKRGQASAMVVIPKGFTLDLLDAKPVTLRVVKNPAERFLPDVVEEFMATMAVMLSGVVQAFAEEVKGLRAMLDGPVERIPWDTLGPEFGKAQKKVSAAAKYLNPLLIGLKDEETKAAGAKPQTSLKDIFSIILPGMAFMFLLFIVQTLMRDLLSEREDGKLRRMMTTPVRPLEIIGARIAGGWIMGLFVLLLMAAFGTLAFGVTWGPFGSFLLLALTASFWTAAFFALFHALVRNRNQAGAIGAPIILAFSLFGGSMMSVEVMPKAFRAVGIVTPNRWFIDGAALVREGNFPLASLIVLFASGLVLLALAVPALRRRASV
ncbi:MAG TPA: ABC transporter permease [Acidobacteriota bacterium]|nr:ABC transporter permease [Acidobacteriota bacterium]